VELVATDPCYLGQVQVAGLPRGESRAVAQLRLPIQNAGKTPATAVLSIHIAPKNFSGGEAIERQEVVTLQPGHNLVQLEYEVPEPRLWWTWDLGEQNLYALQVDLQSGGALSDSWTGTFGIREISGGPDQDWAVYLNGKRLFLRGTVYISNLYMTLMDQATYARDVEMMRDANMNWALVLSNVEKEDFYNLCDERGLLLFQVFPLVWGFYECSTEFADRCKPMMADMMTLLYNHPSIGIWACASEPDLDGLVSIARPMYEAVKDLDHTRILVDGSSVGGYAVFNPADAARYRELCYNTDNHFYDAHFGADVWDTAKRDPLMVTEFGDIGVPSLESLRRFLNDEDIWPPNWDVWRPLFNGSVANMTWPIVHQHRLTWLAVKVEERTNVMAGSVEEFIDITQKWQAFVLKYTIESFRLKKYNHCNGLTNFHFVDMQPAVTTSLLDYYRVPKLAYFAVKDAYRPIHLMMKWPAERYEGAGSCRGRCS
jgi:beta-mannosidase